MEKTHSFYTPLLLILGVVLAFIWIGYGIASFIFHIDILYVILTHCSLLVILTFLFVLLLTKCKSEHARTMLTLEAEKKLEWEHEMYALRNPPAADTKKALLLERTYEVVKNLRRKEGDAIDADSTEEIKSIIKTIDELVKAEKKLRELTPDL